MKLVLTIVVLLAAAGCKDFPGADGRYATRAHGGWDNFRAGVPSHEDGMVAMAPGAHN